MMKKRSFFMFSLLFAFVFSISAVDTIKIGAMSGPVTLDPAESWDDGSSFYIAALFDTLVKMNVDTLRVEPGLATAWFVEDGGKNWVFKLRKGVAFHDGTSFNADAVLFTFNRQLQKSSPYKHYDFPLFPEIFTMLKSVKKIDEYTVSFQLNAPFAPFLETLTVDCAAIVSPTAVKKYKKTFRTTPVGTGPYKLVNWTKDKKIVLERFDRYWQGKPAVKQYLTIIEQKLEMLITMFKNQKIDMLNSYSVSKLVALSGLKWVKIEKFPALSTTFIAFNHNNRALKNLNIRKALNFLWNRKILKFVFQDLVVPNPSIFPRGLVPGIQSEETYPLSLEKAKSLLKKENAKNLKFELLIDKNVQLELQLVNIYAKNLLRAGIKLDIVRVESDIFAKRIGEGKYDLTISGWIADYPDAFSIVTPIFSKELQSKGFANLSGGVSPEIIKLIQAAEREKDKKKRNKIYISIDRFIRDNALSIPLFQNKSLIIYNKRIGSLKKRILSGIDFYYTGR